jgi:hypothetical protein
MPHPTFFHGLHKALQFLAPELTVYLVINGITHAQPPRYRRRKTPLFCQAQCSIHSHPAHQATIKEMLRSASYLPDPFVRLIPVFTYPFDQLTDLRPEVVADRFSVLATDRWHLTVLRRCLTRNLFCAAFPILTGALRRYPSQCVSSTSVRFLRPSIPYMIWTGWFLSRSRQRASSHCMNAFDSDSNPSRLNAYKVKLESRIQI